MVESKDNNNIEGIKSLSVNDILDEDVERTIPVKSNEPIEETNLSDEKTSHDSKQSEEEETQTVEVEEIQEETISVEVRTPEINVEEAISDPDNQKMEQIMDNLPEVVEHEDLEHLRKGNFSIVDQDEESGSNEEDAEQEVEAATDGTADVIVTEDDTDTKEEGVAVAAKPEDTVEITGYDSGHSEPKTPPLGKISNAPIEVLHSIGDIHGWAPGLITYLINNKLAEIEINGFPLQDKTGKIDEEMMDEIFPNPVKRLQRNPRYPPKAGLCGQPGFDDLGVNNEGHKAIKARWIAEPNVALIQVGDVYDRADHSELAAEILRQLMIDAPGRVFVLVGNHEQFMLEEDYDNWYFNEARNAFVDHESRPNRNTRNHFRFLPDRTNTATERANAVFDRYINSTWTLFLTQGAIMEKLGWIKPKFDLKPMLDEGWSGYEHATKLKDEFGKTWTKVIPGALTALVIADTLFHHAEPSAHRTDHGQGLDIPLHKTMTAVESKADNILFRQYTHGEGSIKNSPDAPLLWSRGSSSGASSGNPAAESHLEGLADAWKGLRRIVHGHTPTVGSGDFDSVTGGKSTTVSYLSESPNRQNSKGRANKIRIYNIDEGMSPPYYNGDDSIYSTTRMPTGLRLERDEFSSLEAKSSTDKLVNLNAEHSIDIDSRNLWKWSPNEWRIGAKPDWGTSDGKFVYQEIEHGSWRGYISGKKSDESLKTVWNRNAGSAKISTLMIQKLMSIFQREQNSVKVQEPRTAVLERIPPIGKSLSEDKIKEAWGKISAFLLLLKPDPNGGYSVICVNSTDSPEEIIIANVSKNNTKGKQEKLFCDSKTITKSKINNCEKIFIGRDIDSIKASANEWISGKESISPKSSPVIAYFSGAKKPKSKVELSNKEVINLVNVPRIEDAKKNKKESYRSSWGSSQNKNRSLSDQSKDFKQPNPQQTLVGQSLSNKASSPQPTQPRNQSKQEQGASNLKPGTIKYQAHTNQRTQRSATSSNRPETMMGQSQTYQRSHGSTTSGNKPETMRAQEQTNQRKERPSTSSSSRTNEDKTKKRKKPPKRSSKTKEAGEKVPESIPPYIGLYICGSCGDKLDTGGKKCLKCSECKVWKPHGYLINNVKSILGNHVVAKHVAEIRVTWPEAYRKPTIVEESGEITLDVNFFASPTRIIGNMRLVYTFDNKKFDVIVRKTKIKLGTYKERKENPKLNELISKNIYISRLDEFLIGIFNKK